MRIIFVLIVAFTLGCASARTEVFRTACSYGDSANKGTFFIIADTDKKTGRSDYRNSDLKAAPSNQLNVVSITKVQGGLVGVKLRDRSTGTSYRVDYVKQKRPSNSPYTPDMESVAISGPTGTTTHESCGVSE